MQTGIVPQSISRVNWRAVCALCGLGSPCCESAEQASIVAERLGWTVCPRTAFCGDCLDLQQARIAPAEIPF